MIDKPITVARKEFMDGLVRYINSACLPAFMIVDALEELLPQAKANIQKEYDADLANYVAALKEQEEQTKDDNKNKTNKSKGGKA